MYKIKFPPYDSLPYIDMNFFNVYNQYVISNHIGILTRVSVDYMYLMGVHKPFSEILIL